MYQKNQKEKKFIKYGFIGLLVFAFIISAVLYILEPDEKRRDNKATSPNIPAPTSKALITIRDVTIEADLANNDKLRSRGLSGRKSLGENQGMLFIFSNYSTRSFWMKDMNFGLDFLWINDNRIVDISENVKPPEKNAGLNRIPRIRTNKPVNAVLEVNAGFVKKHGINVGDRVKITVP